MWLNPTSFASEARRSIARALATAPGSGAMVRRFALAPPSCKFNALSRLIAAVSSRLPSKKEFIETNLGISSALRLMLPASKSQLIYGRPDHIVAERATLELCRRLARLSDTFVDVGANEGIFTFLVASDPLSEQRDIHLFEPDAELFARLIDNLNRNKIPAIANNLAVSDMSGRQTFYRNLTDDSSGSLTLAFAAKHKTVGIDIETTSLSEYFVQHNLHHACVKIDVEGAGQAVWNGAQGAIDRIDWLIMEIIGAEVEAKVPRQIISKTGWNAWYIRDFDLVRSVDGQYNYVDPFYNWLFTPKSSTELASVLNGTRFRICEATQKASS